MVARSVARFRQAERQTIPPRSAPPQSIQIRPAGFMAQESPLVWHDGAMGEPGTS
jgi:hypothetical protein